MDWPVRQILADRQRSKPSSRLFLVIAIAAAIGILFFGIWRASSPGGFAWGTQGQKPAPAPPDQPIATAQAPAQIALPRGGSLTGSTDALGDTLTRLVHAPLVRINRSTDQVEPWIAESWTVSADNLTYVFKIRAGILWSDGTPLSAEEIVAVLAAVPLHGGKLAARAIDPLTIEVTFPEPFAPGLRLLDGVPILSAGKPGAGLGPFIAKPGAKGAAMRTLVRNPHYWRKAPDGGTLPYIDELTLASFSPGSPGAPGPLDFVDAALRPDDYEELKKLEQSGKGRIFELGPGMDTGAMWLLNAANKPWLSDEKFRLAISAAIDRRQFCRQVYFGACDPVAGPVTPANRVWFNPDLPLGRGNPLVAREMLANLGFRDRTGDGILEDAAGRSVRFSLLIRGDVAASVRAGAFLKETLRAAGIDVEITPLAAGALHSRRARGAYEALYDVNVFRDTDPAMNLDFWMTVSDPPLVGWQHQINELMLKNACSFDRIVRLQAFADVQRIYSQHVPALFFGAPHVRIFTSPRVLNATPSPLRPHLLWNADSLAVVQ